MLNYDEIAKRLNSAIQFAQSEAMKLYRVSAQMKSKEDTSDELQHIRQSIIDTFVQRAVDSQLTDDERANVDTLEDELTKRDIALSDEISRVIIEEYETLLQMKREVERMKSLDNCLKRIEKVPELYPVVSGVTKDLKTTNLINRLKGSERV